MVKAPARARRRRQLRWLATHRYHLLFGASLVLLGALFSWWAVLIAQSVEDRHRAAHEQLELEAQLYATMLGHMPSSPRVGRPGEESDLEIVACPRESGGGVYRLQPLHTTQCIRPRPTVLAAIEQEHRKKKAMLVGEAGLSVVLVLLTGFMLFRLIHSENRSARELRDLWSRVTHELKTPITGLKAFLQTLQSQDMTREEMQPLVEMALGEVARQERLTENLLVGQRLGGLSRQVIQAVAIVPFLRDYFERPRLKLAREQVALELVRDETLNVAADPTGLRIILDNLVDNAIKYGGTELQLRVRATTEGDWLRLSVEDNGPGLPPEATDAIFRAYRRLTSESGRSRQGTGMGLHIARTLAREMGGELQAGNRSVGQGACFILSLAIKGG